jgi:hypothetical protein
MSIDPARLARIRARLLAAAAITTTVAGCAKPIINDRGPDSINEPPVQDQHPINDRQKPDDTNVAPPDGKTGDDPKKQDQDINRPNPDTSPKFPDPSQTINTAPNQR